MTGTPGRPGPEREMMLTGSYDWLGTSTGVALLTVAALPLAALASRRWRRPAAMREEILTPAGCQQREDR